jgi:hypothetical protein
MGAKPKQELEGRSYENKVKRDHAEDQADHSKSAENSRGK